MRKLIFLVALLFVQPSDANESPEWRIDYFKLGAGIEYISSLAKRGAIFYDSYQVFPIFSLDVFHPDLQIVGTSALYKHRLSENILYRSRFSLNATNDRPLYRTGPRITERNRREKTMEWDHFIEFGVQGSGELTLLYSQDVKAHSGSYFDAKVRKVLFDLPLGDLTYQPGLFGSIGAGTGSHNRYLYGKEADDFSLTNYSFGISIAASPAIDYFFPIIELKRHGILGDQNADASLVHGNSNGWQATVLFAVQIFET